MRERERVGERGGGIRTARGVSEKGIKPARAPQFTHIMSRLSLQLKSK